MKLSCFRLGVLAAALLTIPTAFAGDVKPGAKAPEVKVAEWVKGKPFKSFSESEFTVVEFWATWCGPCIEAIPHLTELSKKHKDKVSFYGVSVWENGDDIQGQVKKFVGDMGEKMAYNVARDNDEAFMATNWMQAAKQNGIPASFLINKEGTVLWIGHPMELDSVLEEATRGKFDLAASIKKFDEEMAQQAKMNAFMGEIKAAKILFAEGKKDEAVAKIDALDAGDDAYLKSIKKGSKLEMFLTDPPRAKAFIDELVKEGKPENASTLIQSSFVVNEESSKETKEMAAYAIEQGVKLNEKDVFTHLMAAYGWSTLGDKAKTLAALDAGEKLIPNSEYKDDGRLKQAFKELREAASK